MTDAERFLSAIRAEPADDVRRLAFADWLDENAACEPHTATAEFVRLTCVPRRCGAIPAAAGRWLSRHWRRLCPALAGYAELHATVSEWPDPCTYVVIRRCGRWLRVVRHQRVLSHDGRAVGVEIDRADIEFARGFVGRVVCRDWRFADVVVPLLVADQPLAAPELTTFCRPFIGQARVFRSRVGPAFDHLVAMSAMSFLTNWRRQNEVVYMPGERNDALARAKADVAQALLARARLVLAGKATAGVDPRPLFGASEPVVEALGGG